MLSGMRIIALFVPNSIMKIELVLISVQEMQENIVVYGQKRNGEWRVQRMPVESG